MKNLRPDPSWRPAVRGLCAVAALLALGGCVVAPVAPYRSGPVYAPQGRALPPAPTLAPLYFYPERNQPEALQDRDRYECYRWAVRETGTDPGMTPVRQPMPMAEPGPPLRDGSGVVAGAATGAVIGAVTSSPRHSGGNAVIGAIIGATIGAVAQESRAQAIEANQARRQQAAEASAAASRQPHDNFRRAMSACMQGRGYRVG
ncbi:YMGG-like glycine zipper-containing protein [Ideonella sp. A 288]|uniref:YMGG-like glycine zipper-containing protein n=1 Tax=Ideonella sp. A 288 TaxID=1962181 RepID=UPI001303CD0C|nr:YMGG-like glycine zipper-containing protein [Ideonella sp. A 288]